MYVIPRAKWWLSETQCLFRRTTQPSLALQSEAGLKARITICDKVASSVNEVMDSRSMVINSNMIKGSVAGGTALILQ